MSKGPVWERTSNKSQFFSVSGQLYPRAAPRTRVSGQPTCLSGQAYIEIVGRQFPTHLCRSLSLSLSLSLCLSLSLSLCLSLSLRVLRQNHRYWYFEASKRQSNARNMILRVGSTFSPIVLKCYRQLPSIDSHFGEKSSGALRSLRLEIRS
jgi:hypothetical protein